MAGFFEQLNLTQDINEWLPVIDWLVQDKFIKPYWKNYIGSYTKQIKRMEKFEINYSYLNLSSIEMPSKRVNHKVYILNGKGESEVKDLLRHIRNAMAHGNAVIFKRTHVYYLEFKDYSDKSRTIPSAYILFPASYLIEMFRIYKKMESKLKKKKLGYIPPI